MIAIDCRGQGRSTRTQARRSRYDVMANDVLAVMDTLEHRAGLDGRLERRRRDRAQARDLAPGARREAVRVRRELRLRGQQAAQHAPGRDVQRLRAEVPRRLLRMSKTPKQYDELIDWLLPVWRNPMDFTKDQLRAIQAPALIADGDHDEIIVLEQIEEMAKLIPHAQLKVFQNVALRVVAGPAGVQQGARRAPEKKTRQPVFERLRDCCWKARSQGAASCWLSSMSCSSSACSCYAADVHSSRSSPLPAFWWHREHARAERRRDCSCAMHPSRPWC